VVARVDTAVLPADGREQQQAKRSPFSILVIALVGAIVFLTLYPLGIIVAGAVLPGGRFDATIWAETLMAPGLFQAVSNTAIIAAVNTAVSVPLGVFFAWLIERTDARIGGMSRLLPVIPLMLPPVALTIGWLFLADPRAGYLVAPLVDALHAVGIPVQPSTLAIQSWGGLIFLYVLYSVPHVYVIAAAAFSSLDPSLEEAARVCGSNRFKCFFKVSMPAIRYAIGSSALLCIISSIALYSIPALLGTAARIDVLSVYIYRLLNYSYPPQTAQAVVLGLITILVIGSVWLLQRKIASRTGHAQMGGMGVRLNPLALGPWKWPARIAVLAYVVMTSILPLLALLVVALQPFWSREINLSLLSLKNFLDFWERGASREAIFNSALLAIASATAVVLTGGLLAIFAKQTGGLWEKTVGIITKVPSAVPNIVFAVGVLVAFGFSPFHLSGTWLIIFLAYIVVFLPSASIAAESSVQQVGNQLVDAARVFGAGPGRTFRTVQLPLILPGLAAGWALVFAIVVGELNVAAILAGPRNPVIGYLILALFDNGTYSQLAALATIIGVIAAITVSATLLLARPKFSN